MKHFSDRRETNKHKEIYSIPGSDEASWKKKTNQVVGSSYPCVEKVKENLTNKRTLEQNPGKKEIRSGSGD